MTKHRHAEDADPVAVAFATYIRSFTGDLTLAAIAARAHTDTALVSRWFSGLVRPSAGSVIRLAIGLNANPVEALVAAGYLTVAEVDLPLMDLSSTPTAALLAEVARRTDVAVA